MRGVKEGHLFPLMLGHNGFWIEAGFGVRTAPSAMEVGAIIKRGDSGWVSVRYGEILSPNETRPPGVHTRGTAQFQATQCQRPSLLHLSFLLVSLVICLSPVPRSFFAFPPFPSFILSSLFFFLYFFSSSPFPLFSFTPLVSFLLFSSF